MAMKLITAVVQDEDADDLVTSLVAAGRSVTKIGTTGGLFTSGRTTLLIGVEEPFVNQVVDLIIDRAGHRVQQATPGVAPDVVEKLGDWVAEPIESERGGALIFVQDVERFVRY